jgi:hypothetical protein
MIAFVFYISISSIALDAPHWWDPKVEASVKRATDRKDAWERALEATPPEHRAGMAYLLTDLPLRDLETLPPDRLIANVELAYKARAEVPWGAGLPEAVFLDSVLPHISVTEPRDSLRAEFHDRYMPLVKDCKTPGEAAMRINKSLFKDYKVGYNTRRLRTDQSSKETIAQGMATCTGLSIMLVEACRSVGVPARVAGINSWPGRGGNHTWAEVWDGGWHFVGACEPDDKGLDHAWFVEDASKAIKESPRNAIYAVTYRTTGEHFPLVWNPGARVNAENVTDRYARGPSKDPAQPRLMVEVVQGGRRVEADVTALDRATGETRLAGKSLGPSADVNLHLSTPVTPGESSLVVARRGGAWAVGFATVREDTVVRLDLDHPDVTGLSDMLADRFAEDAGPRRIASKFLAVMPCDETLRDLVWRAYKSSPMHEGLRKEFDANVVKTADRTSPYLWRHVGEKPASGWSLVIAMHGGGGAPKRVNDGQWTGMFEHYYKDHPEAGGYIYLALRAPNDEWNGFYDDAICPLVERLIRQFVLFGDVDPDRVYTLGASHGGYGAFVIGPKIPDRFAGVHASASAPTDGETMGENLRNTRFTFMVGEMDTAYGRADRCQAFAKLFEAWRKERGGYKGGFEWRPGVGHSVPDRDKVAEMIKAGPRDPHPKDLVWVQSDDVLRHFYWLEAPKPADKARVEASVASNTVRIKATGQNRITLWLDASLVDLARPVVVEVAGGKTQRFTPSPNLGTFADSLAVRGDPRLAAPVRIDVDLKP